MSYLQMNTLLNTINTHYYNRNLIWPTVSHGVDQVIPSITREGDPMVWPHPRDVILNARSSYYYHNLFIPFSDIILILELLFGL